MRSFAILQGKADVAVTSYDKEGRFFMHSLAPLSGLNLLPVYDFRQSRRNNRLSFVMVT